VEGHRYADDAEPSWYSGKNQYEGNSQYDADVSGSHTVGNPYDSGIHERPSGAYRLPEQRPGDGYAVTDPLITTGSHSRDGRSPEPPAAYDSRATIRGPEYPTIKPPAAETPPAPPAPMAPMTQMPPQAAPPLPTDPISAPTSLVAPILRQPERQPERPPESVYHTRRPVSSVLVAIVMVVLMIPVIRLLLDATFSGNPTSRAIVPAVLLALGFTITGIGLFTIARGGPLSRESWLRPPVAYLPAGLILLVAAGLAVA
jgi:hypothetical protein